MFSRQLAQYLTEQLKQSVVVEDRPGAASMIGAEVVAKSAPDGYTLLTISNTLTANESLFPHKSYELMRDFVAVAPLNYSELVMVINPTVPAKSLKEFIALAKAKPGALNYASAGAGTPYHMGVELFKAMTGTDVVNVPHKAAGDSRNNVIAGHVQMMLDAITTMAPNVQAGQVRALGTTGPTRSKVLPDVPTIAEAGVPGYEATIWIGILAPAGNAEADRRQAQCRDQQGDRPPRDEGGLGPPGRDADDDVACGVRRLYAQGHRKVGAGGQDFRCDRAVTGSRGCARRSRAWASRTRYSARTRPITAHLPPGILRP